MHKPQEQVRELHREVVDAPVSPDEPCLRHPAFRAALMLEEAFETACALVGTTRAQAIMHEQVIAVLQEKTKRGDDGRPNLEEAIDGCMDTLVVTYGTLEDIGVDAEPFFDEVHRANMAKKDGPVRADGKRLKPPGWTPPDIKGVLERVRLIHKQRQANAFCTNCGRVAAEHPTPPNGRLGSACTTPYFGADDR